MISADSTSPACSLRERGVEPRNSFVAEFIDCHGLQVLDLLRYEDCAQEGDALRELTQLRALLAGMDVIAPDTAKT